jgi:hypothetical protein
MTHDAHGLGKTSGTIGTWLAAGVAVATLTLTGSVA